MNLRIERRWKKSSYTIGILYINGERFCETLEDKDRGLRQGASMAELKLGKIYGETAIPTGVYKVSINTVSQKYKDVKWYNDLCEGRMPRLINVPAFSGVLIHPGNTALDTLGCILVGRNTKVGALTNSRETFKALYEQMAAAKAAGEEITISIL